MTFDQIQALYPGLCGKHTPEWGLPTLADFAQLEREFALTFPPSFVQFQTQHAARMRAVGDGFRWATPELPEHLSLRCLLLQAQQKGHLARGFVPFWQEGGDSLAFAPVPASADDAEGDNAQALEPPVVWLMSDGSAFDLAEGFVPWLAACYADLQRDLLSHFDL